MNGQLVISLDFEKFWGIFDSKSLNSYSEHLENVDSIIDRLISLSDQYNVKLTFATVGFLFHDSKANLLKHSPSEKPTYTNSKHSPYSFIDNTIESKKQFFFATEAIQKIKANKNHEIGTHTYCHYYCLEEGQTVSQFAEDIKMAIKVANANDIAIKSIVFPRNQVSNDHLKICAEQGIIAYRGYEDHTIYKPRPYKDSKRLWYRIMRIGDAYFNLTGTHIYNLSSLKGNVVNLPSSYFLRPFSNKLSMLEPFKINRIKKGMTKAAKQKKLYHLWFHPHNFGKDVNKNFKNFEAILKTYSSLHTKYNFESSTMSGLAQKLIQKA